MAMIPTTKKMLEKLISSPSISSTHQHLDSSNIGVINLLAEWLESAGFSIEIDTISDQPKKANLIARIGDGEDGLVLSGHTDTVPYDSDKWKYDPFELTQIGTQLLGLGTADMKSFFAFAISAVEKINLKKLTHPLIIVATADEESTMAGAKNLVEQHSQLGKYCVIGEPTDLQPVHQHKGIFMESVTLSGQSGHSSDPALGNNALEGMHEVINIILEYRDSLSKKFVDHNFAVPVPTLNLGHIHGGDNANRICGQCELHYDLRLLPDMDLESVRNNLRDKIYKVAAKRNLHCSFTSLFDGSPALSTPTSSNIVKLTEQITNTSSKTVVFATEGAYFNQIGMETIVLGPGSINVAHQPNEYIDLAQIDKTILLYKELIEKVCMN